MVEPEFLTNGLDPGRPAMTRLNSICCKDYYYYKIKFLKILNAKYNGQVRPVNNPIIKSERYLYKLIGPGLAT